MKATQTNQELQKVIEIKNFSVAIGSKEILRNINLAITEKQITAVIGPSGSGKSVLLKSIVGLFREELSPRIKLRYGGQIYFQGKDLLQLHERELEVVRKRISYVSQYPAAFPGNIYDNLVMALRYWWPGLRRDKEVEIVEGALRAVGLWEEVKHRLRDNPHDLSAGQLQRLCIARAVALDPDLLVLDEPCAFIDPISTLSLEEFFRNLRKDRTIFIVTHNMQQAARISDMTLFMSAKRLTGDSFDLVGEIVEFGESAKIFTRPESELTEDYIVGKFG